MRHLLPNGTDPSTSLYTQVRYVADDIPLSPVRGRDVAVLSMIAIGDENASAPAQLFELYARF